MSYECNKILQDTNLLNPLPQGIEPWNVRKAVAQVCPVMDAISFDGLRRRLRRASEEDIIRGVELWTVWKEEGKSCFRATAGLLGALLSLHCFILCSLTRHRKTSRSTVLARKCLRAF